MKIISLNVSNNQRQRVKRRHHLSFHPSSRTGCKTQRGHLQSQENHRRKSSDHLFSRWRFLSPRGSIQTGTWNQAAANKALPMISARCHINHFSVSLIVRDYRRFTFNLAVWITMETRGWENSEISVVNQTEPNQQQTERENKKTLLHEKEGEIEEREDFSLFSVTMCKTCWFCWCSDHVYWDWHHLTPCLYVRGTTSPDQRGAAVCGGTEHKENTGLHVAFGFLELVWIKVRANKFVVKRTSPTIDATKFVFSLL